MAEARAGRRLGRWLLMGGGVVLFLAFLLSGDQGLLSNLRMQRYERELAGRIAALQAGNAELAAEVKRLADDPAVMEALARTQLQMVRPGEVVYLLPGEAEGGAR